MHVYSIYLGPKIVIWGALWALNVYHIRTWILWLMRCHAVSGTPNLTVSWQSQRYCSKMTKETAPVQAPRCYKYISISLSISNYIYIYISIYIYVYIYGLLPIFLFVELTLMRFSLRAASCGKYLAGPYHDERFGSDFSKVSTVSSAVPFFPFSRLPSLSFPYRA